MLALHVPKFSIWAASLSFLRDPNLFPSSLFKPPRSSSLVEKIVFATIAFFVAILIQGAFHAEIVLLFSLQWNIVSHILETYIVGIFSCGFTNIHLQEQLPLHSVTELRLTPNNWIHKHTPQVHAHTPQHTQAHCAHTHVNMYTCRKGHYIKFCYDRLNLASKNVCVRNTNPQGLKKIWVPKFTPIVFDVSVDSLKTWESLIPWWWMQLELNGQTFDASLSKSLGEKTPWFGEIDISSIGIGNYLYLPSYIYICFKLDNF